MRFFKPRQPKSLQQQIEDRETSEGRVRPRAWWPLYLIGGITIFFIFVFSCGSFLFFINKSDLPEEPTPVPQPRTAEEYFFRATDYGEDGLFELAIQDFSESIRLDPTRKAAFYNRGITYNRMRLYQLAVEDFDAAIALDAEYAAAYANRAFAYTLLGMDDKADADVRRAIELGIDGEGLRQRIEGARLGREVDSP